MSSLKRPLEASHSQPDLGTSLQGVVELNPGWTGAQSGYVSRVNSGTPHVTTANTTARTPITLTPSPAFTCSDDHSVDMFERSVFKIKFYIAFIYFAASIDLMKQYIPVFC